MSIVSRSVFYYGHVIEETNFYIDFDEGSGEVIAELSLGSYSLSEFVIELARAMTEAGTQTYDVTVDRDTRIITITAPSAFSILGATGSHAGGNVLPLAGFGAVDTSSATSQIGTSASGEEFAPQFYLQRFVNFDDIEQAVQSSVNESASGKIEVVSFGQRNFMECIIKFQTNIDMGDGADVETDLTGVDKLRAFMKAIIKKSNIEFMADRENRSNFTKCLLEKTPDSKEGTGFKLRELYSLGLPGFYETGTLVFRKVN